MNASARLVSFCHGGVNQGRAKATKRMWKFHRKAGARPIFWSPKGDVFVAVWSWGDVADARGWGS